MGGGTGDHLWVSLSGPTAQARNPRRGVAACRWHASSDRSQLPLRSALNGRHWRPAPDAAAETPTEKSPTGTFLALPALFSQELKARETLSRALQAFCKKLDQKLLVSLYRTRLGKPSPKTPVSERSERIGVFPALRGHAPGTRPRCGLGREGPGTAPGSAGTAAAKTTGCSRTWGRSGAQTRTPAGNS